MASLPQRTKTFADRLEAIRRDGGAVVAPRIGGKSHLVALQLAEAVSDVHAAGLALADAHRRAIPVFRDADRSTWHPIPANQGQRTLLLQPPELQTLSVLMKAWLFFVRAFCDNAYRLLLGDAEHRPAPRSGSMERVLNEKNPVAVLLATRAPDVPEWFRNLRALRNAMKEGAAFAFSQLDARGLGLTIFEVRAATTLRPEIEVVPRETVTFADIVDDAGRVLELVRALERPRAADP